MQSIYGQLLVATILTTVNCSCIKSLSLLQVRGRYSEHEDKLYHLQCEIWELQALFLKE
jgi:hypothetical protein